MVRVTLKCSRTRRLGARTPHVAPASNPRTRSRLSLCPSAHLVHRSRLCGVLALCASSSALPLLHAAEGGLPGMSSDAVRPDIALPRRVTQRYGGSRARAARREQAAQRSAADGEHGEHLSENASEYATLRRARGSTASTAHHHPCPPRRAQQRSCSPITPPSPSSSPSSVDPLAPAGTQLSGRERFLDTPLSRESRTTRAPRGPRISSTTSGTQRTARSSRAGPSRSHDSVETFLPGRRAHQIGSIQPTHPDSFGVPSPVRSARPETSQNGKQHSASSTRTTRKRPRFESSPSPMRGTKHDSSRGGGPADLARLFDCSSDEDEGIYKDCMPSDDQSSDLPVIVGATAPSIRQNQQTSASTDPDDVPSNHDSQESSSQPLPGTQSQSLSQSQPVLHAQLSPMSVSKRMRARPKRTASNLRRPVRVTDSSESDSQAPQATGSIDPPSSNPHSESHTDAENASDSCNTVHAEALPHVQTTSPRQKNRRPVRPLGLGRTYGSQRAFLVDLPSEPSRNTSASSMGLHSSLATRSGVSFALPASMLNRPLALPGPQDTITDNHLETSHGKVPGDQLLALSESDSLVPGGSRAPIDPNLSRQHCSEGLSEDPTQRLGHDIAPPTPHDHIDAMLGITQTRGPGVRARASYKELLARWGEGEMSDSSGEEAEENDNGPMSKKDARNSKNSTNGTVTQSELQSLTSLRSEGANRLFRDQVAYMLAELDSMPSYRAAAAVELVAQLFPPSQTGCPPSVSAAVSASVAHSLVPISSSRSPRVLSPDPPAPESLSSGFLEDLTSSGLVRSCWSALVHARLFPPYAQEVSSSTSLFGSLDQPANRPALHPATLAEQYDASTIDAALAVFLLQLLSAPPGGTRPRRARALLFGDPTALGLHHTRRSGESSQPEPQFQSQSQPGSQSLSQTPEGSHGPSMTLHEDQPDTLAPDEQIITDLFSLYTSRGPRQLDVLAAPLQLHARRVGGLRNFRQDGHIMRLTQLASKSTCTFPVSPSPASWPTTPELILLASSALVPHLSTRGMASLTSEQGLVHTAILNLDRASPPAFSHDRTDSPSGLGTEKRTAEMVKAGVHATITLLLALLPVGENEALASLTLGQGRKFISLTCTEMDGLFAALQDRARPKVPEREGGTSVSHSLPREEAASCEAAHSSSRARKGTATPPGRTKKARRTGKQSAPLPLSTSNKKKSLSTSRMSPVNSSSELSAFADSHTCLDFESQPALLLSRVLDDLKLLTFLATEERHRTDPVWFETGFISSLLRLATWQDSFSDQRQNIMVRPAVNAADLSEAACAATELLSLLIDLHGPKLAQTILNISFPPAIHSPNGQTRTLSSKFSLTLPVGTPAAETDHKPVRALELLHTTFSSSFALADLESGAEMDAALAGLRAGCTAVLLAHLFLHCAVTQGCSPSQGAEEANIAQNSFTSYRLDDLISALETLATAHRTLTDQDRMQGIDKTGEEEDPSISPSHFGPTQNLGLLLHRLRSHRQDCSH